MRLDLKAPEAAKVKLDCVKGFLPPTDIQIYVSWGTRLPSDNFDKSNNLSKIQKEEKVTQWQGNALIGLESDKNTLQNAFAWIP